MLQVVNYMGRQVHSPTTLLRARGPFLFFDGGAVADAEEGVVIKGALRFVDEGEAGYMPAGRQVGSDITVTDVADDGTVCNRTADGSSVASPDGTYTVNLGDPDGANRGIQFGSGNTQINRF